MRAHGRAQISRTNPRALAICDRCQQTVNHDILQWQLQWRGPRMQNIRLLVCPQCYDVPQEQLRTIVLPVDPVTIQNSRPENYAIADNPVSGLGYNPTNNFLGASYLGGNIGNMTLGGNLNAAFNLSVNKPYSQCATLSVSNSSFQNFVGKNWNGDPSGATITMPSTTTPISHVVSLFVAYAPSDQPFLRSGATGWQFQGANDGATWSTIASGNTAGSIGEKLTVSTTSAAAFSYHRLALQGDGFSNIGIAGLVISISDAFPNEW